MTRKRKQGKNSGNYMINSKSHIHIMRKHQKKKKNEGKEIWLIKNTKRIPKIDIISPEK
jgi:hypothetical protein